MKKVFIPIIFLLCLVLANSPWASSSAPIKMEGINSDAEAYVKLDYTYENGEGIEDVTLENTSSFDSRITGFAFNFPQSTPNAITGMEGFSGDSGWKEQFEPDKIDTLLPVGFFDVAGVTGENRNDGDPNAGIEVNHPKTVAIPKANPLPESGSMLLLGFGLISLASIRRKFRF